MKTKNFVNLSVKPDTHRQVMTYKLKFKIKTTDEVIKIWRLKGGKIKNENNKD